MYDSAWECYSLYEQAGFSVYRVFVHGAVLFLFPAQYISYDL